jgi:hypothetical protein
MKMEGMSASYSISIRNRDLDDFVLGKCVDISGREQILGSRGSA